MRQAANWHAAVERTVTALGYEVVDCERSAQGLLRVFIDRVPGRRYPGDVVAGGGAAADAGAQAGDPASGPSDLADFVTVDDCERVTRQLQYALEVDGCDYARLEVSSPGLDRPLRKPADFARFRGALVDLTLKQAFQGRKKYRGLLREAEAAAGGFELVFQDGKEDKVLGFALEELREARLVPVVDFKGRGRRKPAHAMDIASDGADHSEVSGGHEQ